MNPSRSSLFAAIAAFVKNTIKSVHNKVVSDGFEDETGFHLTSN